MRSQSGSLLTATESLRTQVDLPGYVVLLAALGFLNCLRLVIWRLYFSPISKFPGPKLAALTSWYEAYYDFYHEGGGQFAFQLKRLHEIYRPIIRIGPNEIHIDDPDFYNQVFCSSTPSRPIDKTDKFKYQLGVPDSISAAVPAEVHRPWRAAIAPFFSMLRTRSYNGDLQVIADRISHRLSTEFRGQVIEMVQMWGCMTADMIRELVFGLPPAFFSAPNFRSPFPKAMRSFAFMAHYTRHSQYLGYLFQQLPDAIIGRIAPIARPILDYRREINKQVKRVITSGDTEARKSGHPTIFHHILASSDLPPSELSIDRLTQEAITINAAGIETTAATLTLASFYILNDGSIKGQLRAELEQAMPNPDEILPWEQLEKLPYLSAIVWEALRLSYGVVQRVIRVNRLESLVYDGQVIPANTPVSMDAYSTHANSTIFPSPFEFRPERWLGDDPKGPDGSTPLSRYVVSFTRGSRGCLGMNLAFMELYVALATVFRRHRFELFETTVEDVEFAIDLIKPMPKWGSRGEELG